MSTNRRTEQVLTQFSLLGNTVGGSGAEKPQWHPDGAFIACAG